MQIHINGVNLYYKKRGQGQPLILLHGNGQDHTIYRAMTKKLSCCFTVYAIDSRSHGRSTRTEKLDYETLMEDVVDFIKALEIEKPIIFGFSDGGIIGLLVALHYPQMLCRLIIGGANTNPDGLKNYAIVFLKIAYFFSGSSKIKMMLTEPNITAEDLHKIIVPTLVLAGRYDIVKEDDTKFIASNINGSMLKIIKGESHTSYVLDGKKLYETIRTFIDGVSCGCHNNECKTHLLTPWK